MSASSNSIEKRCALDGTRYTYREFEEYYGKDLGRDMWSRCGVTNDDEVNVFDQHVMQKEEGTGAADHSCEDDVDDLLPSILNVDRVHELLSSATVHNEANVARPSQSQPPMNSKRKIQNQSLPADQRIKYQLKIVEAEYDQHCEAIRHADWELRALEQIPNRPDTSWDEGIRIQAATAKFLATICEARIAELKQDLISQFH